MTDRPDNVGAPSPGQGVYGISVAAELSGIPVQSLRLYERHGLLRPARSDGGTRRYSADDLTRLRRISELVAAGVNLAGIARILDLQDDNAALLAANSYLKARVADRKPKKSKSKSSEGKTQGPGP
ncbi:helix-turn-helix transcriptional regulator [Mycobacterium sp.]|uniref:MerR family transcriptional regulator n=1 Tax=Mycobacterium sp. TaxID=1785 RepID=UPI001275D2CC|nr:helix-turn-helix transcriptional regulator [Mycobacterium sp.]KAA8966909.1 MAG: helix-turn-helix transcriptional regulator [Mycobacterium sp.]